MLAIAVLFAFWLLDLRWHLFRASGFPASPKPVSFGSSTVSSVFRAEVLHPLPDRFELPLGVAGERRIRYRMIVSFRIARHDGRGREPLRKMHPALEVVVAQPFSGESEIGTLPFEILKRFP